MTCAKYTGVGGKIFSLRCWQGSPFAGPASTSSRLVIHTTFVFELRLLWRNASWVFFSREATRSSTMLRKPGAYAILAPVCRASILKDDHEPYVRVACVIKRATCASDETLERSTSRSCISVTRYIWESNFCRSCYVADVAVPQVQ